MSSHAARRLRHDYRSQPKQPFSFGGPALVSLMHCRLDRISGGIGGASSPFPSAPQLSPCLLDCSMMKHCSSMSLNFCDNSTEIGTSVPSLQINLPATGGNCSSSRVLCKYSSSKSLRAELKCIISARPKPSPPSRQLPPGRTEMNRTLRSRWGTSMKGVGSFASLHGCLTR